MHFLEVVIAAVAIPLLRRVFKFDVACSFLVIEQFLIELFEVLAFILLFVLLDGQLEVEVILGEVALHGTVIILILFRHLGQLLREHFILLGLVALVLQFDARQLGQGFVLFSIQRLDA